MRRKSLLAISLFLVSTSLSAAVIVPPDPKVAFTSNRDGNNEIYTMNLDGTSQTRLTNNSASDTQASFAKNGKIAFVSERDGNAEIYVMTSTGLAQTRLTNDPTGDRQPNWSPDGTRIVFQSQRSGGGTIDDIFIMDADGTDVSRLTTNPTFDVDPAFSPKGDKIVFASDRDGNHEIYVMNVDGSGQTRLTNNSAFEIRPEFTRDGSRIAFNRMVPAGGGGGLIQELVVMNADGTGQTVITSTDDGRNGNPGFAPDNRLFFDSSRDGNDEIYALSADGSLAKRLTNNTASDSQPSVLPVIQADTFGIYRPTSGLWILNASNSFQTDLKFAFGGQPNDKPIAGDWNGDGRTDIGVFRDGTWHLALVKPVSNGGLGLELQPLQVFNFGQAGDRPMAGDWNGDGTDDIGVFRPTSPGTLSGKFLIRKPVVFSVGVILVTLTYNFGSQADLPIAGDWDGDGVDTPGVFRPDVNGSRFLLSNEFAITVAHDIPIGDLDLLPLAGDWTALGQDGVGLFVPTGPLMGLIPDVNNTKVILTFNFGQPGDVPVAGHWTEP